MGVGKGGNRNPPFRLAFAYFRPVESRPPEGGPPRKGNLLSDHTELLCEKRKSVCCRLRRRLPPGGPFLNDQKGAKESVKEGDSDFPLLDNPPLKTARHRGAPAPLLDVPPEPSYRKAPCAAGLRCNAVGARSVVKSYPHAFYEGRGAVLEMPSRDVCPARTCGGGGARTENRRKDRGRGRFGRLSRKRKERSEHGTQCQPQR